ncbi:MAG: rhomboid family intramembrane serine protease [Chthonomonadaceae bacterium]|nr:rhomboid family intramembrane serine protease [Chthonomonadaceae bacterium]
MLFIPYRAKNPPERFPYVTLGLIIANILIFVFTSEGGSITLDAVEQYALSWNTFSVVRLFCAVFLHANVPHLAFNMLGLWLFGAALEGRLNHFKYMIVYLLSGICGYLAFELVVGINSPEQFTLGASGAVMGLCGAYLYVFPYSTICVFFWIILRFWWAALWEWQARYVVILYLAVDLISQFLFKKGDGVAHMAHIGGAFAGLAAVWILRVRRDNEEVSNVQAARAEIKDYSYFSANELEPLVSQPTEDMHLILAYCERATSSRTERDRTERVLQLLNYYSLPLMDKIDPQRLAYVLLSVPVQGGGLPQVYYLRLASRLERAHSNDLASQLYRRVYDLSPSTPDSEAALFRLSQLMQNVFGNRDYAITTYTEQLRLFPHGSFSTQARHELQKLQGQR